MSVAVTIRDNALRALRPLLGGVELNQLARLVPVAALVRESAARTVLDVGSGSRGLARWLPASMDVTAVDASFDDYGAAERYSGRRAHAVLGDVRELPFADGSFDAVAAVDLLEHVPSADRELALDELVRVTARRLVVACPTGTAALATDLALAERLPRPPGWLDEHLENGFPEADAIRGRLEHHGRLIARPNLALSAHDRLIRAELSPLAYVPSRLAASVLGASTRFGGAPARVAEYTLAVIRGRDRPPAYRTIFCLDIAR